MYVCIYIIHHWKSKIVSSLFVYYVLFYVINLIFMYFQNIYIKLQISQLSIIIISAKSINIYNPSIPSLSLDIFLLDSPKL